MLDSVIFERIAKRFVTPVYVYDEEKIREQVRTLYYSIPCRKGDLMRKCLLYAIKANSNPEILRILKTTAVGGVDAVSLGEIKLALSIGFNPRQIIFTGNSITDAEMYFAMEKEVRLNVDSLSRLEKVGKKYPGSEIWVRINSSIGAGHHSHCITGGPESKFGIYYTETEEIKRIAKRHGLKIVGLHQHIGSQILEVEIFLKAMKALLKVAQDFPNLRFLDFGGGLGVPYRPEEQPLDIKILGKEISVCFQDFCNLFARNYGRQLTLILEPGRFLVAEAGYLLVRVTDIKNRPDGRVIVGVDSGFNHLIRPAMYDSYHEIINISNPRGKKEIVDIVGNLCESGDRFAVQREINHPREGDLLVIKNAGAYGYMMSSNYNFRPKPAEVLVKPNNELRLIRRREYIKDLMIRKRESIKNLI